MHTFSKKPSSWKAEGSVRHFAATGEADSVRRSARVAISARKSQGRTADSHFVYIVGDGD